jgi:hypothetical protein
VVVPKVNVYLPDDLRREVKEYGVSLSSVCQHALEREVMLRRALAENNVDAVAERLWQTKLDEDEDRFASGYGTGASWAREVATYSELERVSRQGRHPDFVFEIDEAHSLVAYLMRVTEEPDPSSFVMFDAADPHDRGLIAGAIRVWDQVSPLLKRRRDEFPTDDDDAPRCGGEVISARTILGP